MITDITTAHLLRKPLELLVGGALVAGLLLTPAPAHATECDSRGVCVAGAAWSEDSSLTDKKRKSERKKNKKKKDAKLSLEITNGRGSVFIDGVWIGSAPLSYMAIKPGKHDVEVRDGENILAMGVVTIGKKGGDVRITVPGGGGGDDSLSKPAF